jgi:hypothetical protein
MPIPPRYSAGRLNTWLSLIVLPLVCAEPVAVGRSTLPAWMPLPEMSVTTLPFTTACWVPSPRASPAAPRCTNASPTNWMFWSYVNDTLPGIWVHAAYGHLPSVYDDGGTWHRPWDAAPSEPVTW